MKNYSFCLHREGLLILLHPLFPRLNQQKPEEHDAEGEREADVPKCVKARGGELIRAIEAEERVSRMAATAVAGKRTMVSTAMDFMAELSPMVASAIFFEPLARSMFVRAS